MKKLDYIYFFFILDIVYNILMWKNFKSKFFIVLFILVYYIYYDDVIGIFYILGSWFRILFIVKNLLWYIKI